jgi:hypothetical protein
MDGKEFKFVQMDGPEGTVRHFSYTKLPDGGIRELSVSSSDGGKTWKTNFDARWRRKQ